MHKSRVHRPDSAHRCTVNLVRSCQAPVITHMQLRLQKIYSIIASEPRKMRIMRKLSEAKHSPSLNYRHRLFCLALICSFTAKDRDLVLTSVFFTRSQTICVQILTSSSGCPNICCREKRVILLGFFFVGFSPDVSPAGRMFLFHPEKTEKSGPRKSPMPANAQLSSQENERKKNSGICGENSGEEIKPQTQVPDKTNC